MPLLSEQDRQNVGGRLAAITTPVTLLFFTQTFGAPETAFIAKRIVDELATLSDQLSVEEVNFILDKDRAAQYGVEGVPAIVLLRNGEDTGIRFLGAPAGYEFASLVDAAVLAGSADSGLSEDSKSLIAKHITEPAEILVFVTPTCPHCPKAVTLAHRMAAESPLIRATCVDATEFLELSQRSLVTGVPKTVVNGARDMLGALPEDVFVRAAVGAPEPASPEPPSQASPS